jgi:riboflavin kinase/FMN adenylyltransferase
LYGESVGFDFTARLRGTETFASVDDLVVQMAIDVAQSREILGV